MKKDDRYDVSTLIEAQFEPGSDNRVLKNKLGIKSSKEMDRAEAFALEKAIDQLIKEYDEQHQFTAADICEFHKVWLSDIYEWAGQYRQVNISKDGFPFAMAAQIPALMMQFERDILKRLTPCDAGNQEQIGHALAKTHVELVLIHPFRDGNGRVARILSILMALQAGLPLLDFSPITGEGKKEYFAAIQTGLDKELSDYGKDFCSNYQEESFVVLIEFSFSISTKV